MFHLKILPRPPSQKCMYMYRNGDGILSRDASSDALAVVDCVRVSLDFVSARGEAQNG